MTFTVNGVVSSKNSFEARCVYKDGRVGGGVTWKKDATPEDITEANAIITREVNKRLRVDMATGYALADTTDQADQTTRDFVEHGIVPPGAKVPWCH
jgi:hypothetical protein